MVKNDEHTLVIFMDDDGSKVEHWVELLEHTLTYIRFRDTKDNIITIPVHRILKMKRKGMDGDYGAK